MTAGGVLTAEQREQLRDLLLAERRRCASQAEAMRRTFDELVAASDLEPPDDEHDPDGTTAYERAQVSSLRSEAEGRVVALDAALDGLDAADAGTCSSCGAAITFPRLVAVLGTDRCVDCASGRNG